MPKKEEEEENEEEGEKEEDSSLYSRAHLATHALAHARMRVRHLPWPSHQTPLLAHEFPPTHTHARAPPLHFPTLVQFLRFASYSIFRHFVLTYYTYICVYVHACPQHMPTRTSLATHALVTRALATHALATHACACGTASLPLRTSHFLTQECSGHKLS